MKNPRRSPEQTRAAEKQRAELQRVKDEEMSRRMREAYQRTQSRSASGMKGGGMAVIIEAGERDDDMDEMDDMDDKYEMMAGGMTYGAGAKNIRDTFKRGGMAKVRTSKNRDGIAIRGKTKGRMV